MSDPKPGLARDGTMQVTAKEGIDYLKAEGKEELLKAQGLAEDKPEVTRDNTMVSTAKEAERILDGNKPDEDAQTRGQAKQIEELKNESEEPPAKKAKLAKDSTMAATAKEAERILDGDKPDEDAQTRGQAKQIEELKNEEPALAPASPAKKAKLAKAGTMAVTAKEGKAILSGEKLGDTRQETAVKQAKSPLKKKSTMAKTAEEAKQLLGDGGDVDVNSGRRTRSQSRGDTPRAPLKKAGTMQKTAKEGKEFLKRGKGKKSTEEAS